MTLSHSQRLERYIQAIGAGLQAATLAYDMLMDELEVPPAHGDDPLVCQHVNTIEANDQRLCNDCGENLDA